MQNPLSNLRDFLDCNKLMQTLQWNLIKNVFAFKGGNKTDTIHLEADSTHLSKPREVADDYATHFRRVHTEPY
jgi:hypothetical protein